MFYVCWCCHIYAFANIYIAILADQPIIINVARSEMNNIMFSIYIHFNISGGRYNISRDDSSCSTSTVICQNSQHCNALNMRFDYKFYTLSSACCWLQSKLKHV